MSQHSDSACDRDALAQPVVTALPPVPAQASHPTACPAWCRHRADPASHHFGPTATWHWGRQQVLANPDPLEGDEPVLVRAQLCRTDEGDGTGEALLFLSGESDVELDAAALDVWLVQAQAFVDTLRIMRQQMAA